MRTASQQDAYCKAVSEKYDNGRIECVNCCLTWIDKANDDACIVLTGPNLGILVNDKCRYYIDKLEILMYTALPELELL